MNAPTGGPGLFPFCRPCRFARVLCLLTYALHRPRPFRFPPLCRSCRRCRGCPRAGAVLCGLSRCGGCCVPYAFALFTCQGSRGPCALSPRRVGCAVVLVLFRGFAPRRVCCVRAFCCCGSFRYNTICIIVGGAVCSPAPVLGGCLRGLVSPLDNYIIPCPARFVNTRFKLFSKKFSRSARCVDGLRRGGCTQRIHFDLL